MRLMDPNFRGHRKNYFIQSVMAMAIIFLMTLFIDVFLQTAIIASLGATVFILFTIPHKQVSNARYIFGGYTFGIIAGEVCYLIKSLSFIQNTNQASIIMALAVGMAMILMVVTNTEHPPAAALAMGICMEGANFMTVVAMYISLLIVYIGKMAMNRWLRDLV